MRKKFAGMICLILFFSCAKQEITAPNEAILPFVENDTSLQVKTFIARQSDGTVKIAFTTALEKNLSGVLLLRGSSSSQFCRMKIVETDGNSTGERTYNFIDNQPETSSTFYVIKYTTLAGDWGCSNVYKSTP